MLFNRTQMTYQTPQVLKNDHLSQSCDIVGGGGGGLLKNLNYLQIVILYMYNILYVAHLPGPFTKILYTFNDIFFMEHIFSETHQSNVCLTTLVILFVDVQLWVSTLHQKTNWGFPK